MIHALWSFGFLEPELDLERTPGNQLFLDLFFSDGGGGGESSGAGGGGPLTGVDTARGLSAETARMGGGWAETLRPRGASDGGAWCGCRRLG